MKTHLTRRNATLNRAQPLAITLLLTTPQGFAYERCCVNCGCHDAPIRKTCRLVCEQKKVTVTCWSCKEEDFCVPGPSRPGCEHVESVCNEPSDSKAPCTQPKKISWSQWCASDCAHVNTKQILTEKTLTKTMPNYTWLLERLCDQCQADCAPMNVPTGTIIPQTRISCH